MWSEQPTEQGSASAPILESTIIGGGEEHVIIKLLTTNNAGSSGGSEVLTKLLTGPSAQGTAVAGILLGNVQGQMLRKIEPKPSESGNEGEKLVENEGEANVSGRYINNLVKVLSGELYIIFNYLILNLIPYGKPEIRNKTT